ncbi:MAG: methylmalonyl-CoA mutase [Desulfobacteraceae bacterium]|nr:methylmalonyl-CoA mutase [Desulfobacteraceae bacterium]
MTNKSDSLIEAYFEKPKKTETLSGLSVKEFYNPEDTKDLNYEGDMADPGEYPYTRGIYRDMYRGRYWTRREVCGYGTAAETNERLKFHMKTGASGLSVIPDIPTQLGVDGDHPQAMEEVGLQGAPFTSLKDVEDLVSGIPLDKISMSFNESASSCPVTLAQYIIVAEKQGVDKAKLRGTMQNDPLHARYCGYRPNNPIDLSVRASTDIIEYCTKHMPLWTTGNVNLYDWREMGINAPQEIAFGFSVAMAYIDGVLKRGLDIDEFAPRRGFYCSAHIDFFEEIAKLRAARRMWSRIMREQYGAKNPRSLMFRFGVHTAGCSLVPQQPLNNIIRIAYEALVAVLGGVQSLHCCSYDEPISLPTEESHRLAIRTQQILAFETGVANATDPLGGSYYVESLTNRIEEEATAVLKEIEKRGGAVECMKTGWFDAEVEEAALKYQRDVEAGERVVVGVNAFTIGREKETPGGVHRVAPASQKLQVENVKELKQSRDNQKVRMVLQKLRQETEKGEHVNLMPAILEAVSNYATRGEIMGTIRQVYGYSYDSLGVVESPF